MNKAPLVRATLGAIDHALWPHYEAWRLHYDGCSSCNTQDWYTPERHKLCLGGVRAFNRWDRATVTHGFHKRDDKED